jgi:hypothetical protein
MLQAPYVATSSSCLQPLAHTATGTLCTCVMRRGVERMYVMQGGFFCQAGPMEMFVSQWLLPEHFQYESTTEPMFTSTVADQPPIRGGCSIRVRIVGYKVQAGKQVIFYFLLTCSCCLCSQCKGWWPSLRSIKDTIADSSMTAGPT